MKQELLVEIAQTGWQLLETMRAHREYKRYSEDCEKIPFEKKHIYSTDHLDRVRINLEDLSQKVNALMEKMRNQIQGAVKC